MTPELLALKILVPGLLILIIFIIHRYIILINKYQLQNSQYKALYEKQKILMENLDLERDVSKGRYNDNLKLSADNKILSQQHDILMSIKTAHDKMVAEFTHYCSIQKSQAEHFQNNVHQFNSEEKYLDAKAADATQKVLSDVSIHIDRILKGEPAFDQEQILMENTLPATDNVNNASADNNVSEPQSN